MNCLVPNVMPDVQGSRDERELPIHRVGIRGVRYPVAWRGQDGGVQHSVAQFAFSVALPAEQKGTHMSRFHELLESGLGPLDAATLAQLHDRMLERLDANEGTIELSFPFFVSKSAPVSGVSALMDYEVSLRADGPRGAARVALKVLVPVTSLCPCSKSIADYGAHNQRSHVTVTIEGEPMVDAAELVALIEAQASSELYGLLKRVDEKYVTERAYDNPKFVEDLVRDVAASVARLPGVRHYVVEAENFESIHNHSAYARIES
ncbi:MAG: GTP cyclohydrolase I FolE2 [Burkholderiaceae bacterium]|nr:GTP cyclohydrolase I FolE2 [Burkholderiaceae bacterium]